MVLVTMREMVLQPVNRSGNTMVRGSGGKRDLLHDAICI